MCSITPLRAQLVVYGGSGGATRSRHGVTVGAAPQRLSPAVETISVPQKGNIVPMTQHETSRRAELEQAARAAVNADNDWWRLDAAACAPNLRHAASPRDLKRDILAAADAGHLVLVDYFKPGCHACRSLAPKLKQLAEQNPDVLILKVNTEELGMRELAGAMGVEVLPWFQIWRAAEPVAAFTANLSTLERLRAEVAAHKACTDPLCETH